MRTNDRHIIPIGFPYDAHFSTSIAFVVTNYILKIRLLLCKYKKQPAYQPAMCDYEQGFS